MTIPKSGASPGARGRPREGPRPILSFPALPGKWLTDVAGGQLFYKEGGEPEGAPGIWIEGKKGGRYLLQAAIRVLSTMAGDRGAVIYLLEVTPPGRAAILLRVTRKAALDGSAWSLLDGGIVEALPVSDADFRNVYAALNGLARIQKAPRTRLVDTLGWEQENGRLYKVFVNGVVSAAGVLLDNAAPVACAVQDLPYTLPSGALPPPSARYLAALLDFWPPEITLFPLAHIGACAEVSKPYQLRTQPGRLDWQAGIVGVSAAKKTAFLNHAQGAFFGAGFYFNTSTMLTDGGRVKDTALGGLGLRALLAYNVVVDQDMNALPGSEEYEPQQKRRIAEVGADGDNGRGGMRSNRENGLEARRTASGLVVRTMESNPFDYTVAHKKYSTDAREVTAFLAGEREQVLEGALERSKALSAMRTEGHAFMIAWYRYLAEQEREAMITREGEYRASACALFEAEITRLGAPPINDRAEEQTADMVAGLYELCRMLRAGSVADGAALADRIESQIPALVRDRAEHAAELYALHHAGGASAEQSQAEIALDAIRSLFLDGRAHLLDKQGNMPDETTLGGRHASLVGWRQIGADWRGSGAAIGQIEGGRVYLSPVALLNLLHARTHFTLSERRLYDVLQGAGALAETGADQTTVQKKGFAIDKETGALILTQKGKNARRLALRLDALYPQSEPESDQGAAITAEAITTTQPEPEAPPEHQAPASSVPASPQLGRADWQDLLDALPRALRSDELCQALVQAYGPHRKTLAIATRIISGESQKLRDKELMRHIGIHLLSRVPETRDRARWAAQEVIKHSKARSAKGQQAAPALPF